MAHISGEAASIHIAAEYDVMEAATSDFLNMIQPWKNLTRFQQDLPTIGSKLGGRNNKQTFYDPTDTSIPSIQSLKS